MLGMIPQKAGNWEAVGKKAEERKKKAAAAEPEPGAPRAGAGAPAGPPGKGGKGKGGAGSYTNGAFAEFDRFYATQAKEKEAERKAANAAAAAAATAAAVEPKIGGRFAGFAESDPAPRRGAAPAAPGSDGGSDGAAASASGGGGGVGKKAKAPKAPKKPRVTVAAVAAGIDAAAVQETIAGLQQRYAVNEASQVEVLADSVAKMFKEAQVDLPKALATKPLARCVGIPMDEVPAPLANALASFCSSVGDAALAEVGVALLAALAEAMPLDPASPPPQAKQQAGLLIMLATMLRARPGALVLAAPQLLALGRALTAPGRLPLLLWALSQAAAAEPAAAAAAWVRVLLPQCLGAPLPAPGGKGGAGGGAPAAPPRMDAASQEAAVALLEGLLKQLGPGAVDVALGGGALEPVVPGAAVEALARAAAPPAPDAAPAGPPAGGKGKAGGAAAAAAAAVAANAALAARLHAPLLALAGASRAGGRQQGEWLVMALETAGMSAAALDAADALTDRAAASVAACLASPSGEAAFEVWESKHKGQLRGSSRVLAALARRPELLRPVLAGRGRAEALRKLLDALPSRHKAFLAAGKGWQAAAAASAERSAAALRRRAAGGWGGAFGGGKAAGKGGKAGGGGGGLAGGALAAAAVFGSLLVVASTYRREVAGVVQHYAGRPAAEALDASLLAPLSAALAPARLALAPHAAKASAALAPHAAKAAAALEPHIAKAAAALAPLAAELQRHAEPAAAAAGEAWRQLAAQAQEIYARATQPQ
ncbi:MAG: hypothetical protein J3K34DRAFT_527379 [Monoraphidium minutum]|nr:MAG: hypothetical protein J3K34DRAFT_527379 [Monoraphidium minutum]